MSQRNRDIRVEVSVQSLAKNISQNTAMAHASALNLVAQASGFKDFGALKAAKEKQSANIQTADLELDQVYSITRFVVVHGEFEFFFNQAFMFENGASQEDIEWRGYQYAAAFYVDEDEDDVEAIAKEISTSGSVHINSVGIVIKKVISRRITKLEYEAYCLAQNL